MTGSGRGKVCSLVLISPGSPVYQSTTLRHFLSEKRWKRVITWLIGERRCSDRLLTPTQLAACQRRWVNDIWVLPLKDQAVNIHILKGDIGTTRASLHSLYVSAWDSYPKVFVTHNCSVPTSFFSIHDLRVSLIPKKEKFQPSLEKNRWLKRTKTRTLSHFCYSTKAKWNTELQPESAEILVF